MHKVLLASHCAYMQNDLTIQQDSVGKPGTPPALKVLIYRKYRNFSLEGPLGQSAGSLYRNFQISHFNISRRKVISEVILNFIMSIPTNQSVYFGVEKQFQKNQKQLYINVNFRHLLHSLLLYLREGIEQPYQIQVREKYTTSPMVSLVMRTPRKLSLIS